MNSILTGDERRCYITGAEGYLEKHHIYFGTKNRAISDKYGFWVYLTVEMHRGTKGVHGRDGHKLDLFLKQQCQKEFEKNHTREEFRALIGKSYLY